MELLKPDSPFGYAGDDALFSMAEVQTALLVTTASPRSCCPNYWLPVPIILSECWALKRSILRRPAACWQGGIGANADSRGAVLFREWLTRYPYNETYLGRELFALPFNPAEPLTTPLDSKMPRQRSTSWPRRWH